MSHVRTLSAAEISSERLLLRRALRAADREAFVELSTDPDVQSHLGGPRPRSEAEQRFEQVLAGGGETRPGNYAIADRATDRFLGTLMLSHRPPGETGQAGEELELGYVLRRSAWGAGLAFEAATAALRAAAGELPDQPVVLVTQTANERSMNLAARLGFRPVRTFEEYGAEQTLCTAPLSLWSS
ncbi:GCN5-related N-acetyltransferase [[Actinomadura] parvosata subsp. kistnae]|uniref:GNAT family N-acetyltransferase n=1 Tax=[Actinomadura] parvosata subsp. kistnae TaxID=1909395 RepID=A0A1U9ZUM8_9ACTN|nr:GNAT family N-acetyltransferase [Nonomuraea sp. ATCC 55076]AQZ61647.1 GNAT family N-acetyltransferase [Nonomuraea sp. ATCC 55076]SPL87749.1 GCN5-related N-acetyltransferase [Actinomadura parvosata subsp. kistnae]